MSKIHGFRAFLSSGYRKKRMKAFMHTFDMSPETKILDIGGTPYNWQLINCPAQITLVNIQLPNPLPALPENIQYIQGDGCALDFDDKSFDIVFSNSVIEHLGSFDKQKAFAREVKRVGKSIWIQTPSRTFFFEPHFITPLFHFLPKHIQSKLGRNFTVWGLIARPSLDQVKRLVEEINLLSISEFQSLFPTSQIKREKFLGLFTKSFIAIEKDT